MKILVTGGAGFIGSYLVEKLVKQGNDVVVIDDLSTGSIDNLKSVEEDIGFLHGKIEEMELDKFPELKDIEQVYHLAACVGVKKVLEDPLGCIQTNMHGTMVIVDFCVNRKREGFPVKLFLASTSEVYGKNDKQSLLETDDRITGSTQKSRWIYAETKAMDEMLVNVFHEKFNLNVLIGRFFSIVGPRQVSRYGMVLPKFVEQALNNKDITIYGDGTQIRSFMHVTDCVDCILELMNYDTCGMVLPKIFNIGNPDPIMIKDLAWRVKHWAESTSKLKFVSYEEAYGSGFEDMLRRVPDIDLLQAWIGKKRFQNIDEIINNTLSYYKTKL